MRRHKLLLVFFGVLGVLLVAILLLVKVARPRFEPMMRKLVVTKLQERFQSDIDLAGFRVSLFPIIATGDGLVVRHKGRSDVPPLITIQRFSFHASLRGLLRKVKHVDHVRLEGLQIHVPPRRHGHKEGPREAGEETPERYPFVLEEMVADGTTLVIMPKKAGKDPLIFDIQRLGLRSVGADRPMKFVATLTNATPPGLIRSSGEFGPWRIGDPGETPVSGTYTFRDADLSDFHGISGILSSDGKYNGVLERIEVDGTTDTPDFRVAISGNPVHLKTQFHAIVDGTDGDTLLEPVKAQFGRTSLVAHGGVVGTKGVKGKTVSLDVTVLSGRVEDLMRLAVKSKPPVNGAVAFRTKLRIPPGPRDIADKLYLHGQFEIGSAQFTNINVREKIAELSRRGQGKADEPAAESVASNLQGRFVLNNGTIEFSKLSFLVPGAEVELNGTYALRKEELDFHGALSLEAKLSQTMTGIKSMLLRPVDPFFRKQGRTVLPIKVVGNREDPKFGLELRRKRDASK